MMSMKIIFFAILLVFTHSAFAKTEVRFTPSTECEDVIVSNIDKAQKSVDAAIYSINNRRIVRALKKAHRRGIKLRILTDRLQAGAKSSKTLDLYREGINIRVNSRHKIEHNKFAIFDGNKVSTGSFNWTNPASEKNSENCLLISREQKTVAAYKKRFEELWRLNDKAKSESWFERKERQ